MTSTTLRGLWSHTLPGTLDPEDIEAIEGIAGIPLRAAHRPHEATFGHRFLQSSDRGDTVIRLRRDANGTSVVLDLVSSDSAQTVEDWQHEIDVLEEAVQTVHRLRQMRELPARPQVFVSMAMTDTVPAAGPVGFAKLVRMLKILRAAGVDADLPESAPDQLWTAGSLAHSVRIEPLVHVDRARLADVDLVVVLGSGAVGSDLASHLAGLWMPLLSVDDESPERDVVRPFDAQLRDLGEPQELRAWLEAALPQLTQRARTRRSLFHRLLRQLPRARARLTSLDDAVVERSGLSREAALTLLRSPAAYASATVSETYALHLALGTDFVPHLQFRPFVRLVTPPQWVPGHEWVATVAGPFLSEREAESLAVAARSAQATAEQLTRAVETYLDMLTDSRTSRRLTSTDDWSALIAKLRHRPDA